MGFAIYIFIRVHFPCLNRMEANRNLASWSATTPIHIPAIPQFNTYPKNQEPAVRITVTLTVEATAVYRVCLLYTSDAADER